MIKHQTQPTHNSCVSTCLAMLAGLPAQEVVDKFHDRYWARASSLIPIFEELDIIAVPCASFGSIVHYGQVYLICMPSLNVKQGTHQIIVDFRDELTVLDPANGRIMDGGKPARSYTEKTVFRHNWFPEWRILDCPAFRRD